MTWAPQVSYSIDYPAPQAWGDPTKMFTLSQQLIKSSDDFLQQLEGQAGQLAAPVINSIFPTIAAVPSLQSANEPTLIDVTWTVPQAPAAFAGTLTVGNLFPAPFLVPPPTLSFPAAPQPFVGLIPAAPGLNLNFNYPDALDIKFPSAPSLLTLDAVSFDVAAIPDFDVTVPAINLVAPSVKPYVEGPPFTSTLLTQCEADLLRALQEGTWTGLPGDVETAMWDRAREREYRQQADALATLDRDMSVLGYAYPPGVYLDAKIKIQTETNYTIAGLSREIMIKQAELTLQNITEARKVAVELEGKMIDYTNSVNNRTFESQKYLTEAAIAIYNSGVQIYQAQLRGYEVQATVYDTRIKGLLANVEIIKAHVQYEEAQASINTQLVEQYKAQLSASQTMVNIYQAQLGAIQTQAGIEETKIKIYGAQIQAFAATTNAYTAEVEGYKAVVESQGVIESVYKTQVEAFGVQVDAAAKQSDILIAEYKGQIEAYTAQLEGYKASLEAMVAQADAASKYNIAEAEVYKAEASAIASYNQTLTGQWEAVLNEQVQVAQVGVAAAKANGDLYIAARGLSLDASKVGAQVNAQLGAAALGAVHWQSSLGWSTSESVSTSNSSSNVGEFITSKSESV